MQNQRLLYLLNAWSSGTATKAEQGELFILINEDDKAAEVNEHIQQLTEQHKNGELFPALDWNKLFDKILQNRQRGETLRVITANQKIKISWIRFIAAACLIALISTAVYTWIKQPGNINKPLAKTQPEVIVKPGSNKAILTLANGKKVNLDSIHGSIIQQNKKVAVNANSMLNYNANAAIAEVNTLSTPRGGQYSLQLSDGTKVWLNAASSITFPTIFTGNKRSVSITGEAYFEVAKNKAKPFYVKVNDIDVEVLGTHFNINGYADEDAITTTLLEGSVKIASNNKITLLTPGQQAQVYVDGKTKLVKDADTEQITAWKSGNFYFKNDDIVEIMKQLSRWYNVDVIMNESIPKHYSGTISRQENLSNVLSLLQLAGGVHFKILDNKIIVTNS